MKLTLTALTVAATMFASSASAFDPADLQKLKDTNECLFCDLGGANLESADVMNANLYRADLAGANLRGAAMVNADLRNAFLMGADLGGAQMMGAILCNTTMPDGSVIYSGCSKRRL